MRLGIFETDPREPGPFFMGLGGAYTRRYRGGRTAWASWRRLPLRYFHIFYCFNVCVTNRHHGRHGLLSATGAKLVSMERFFFSLLRFLRVLGINIIFCYLGTDEGAHPCPRRRNEILYTEAVALAPEGAEFSDEHVRHRPLPLPYRTGHLGCRRYCV